MNIERFYVLGQSGGSPYVIACCADAILRKRILGATIVSGVYPFSLGMAGMPIGPRVLFWTAASRLSGIVAPLLDWSMGNAARDQDPEKLARVFMQEMAGRHEKDLRCLDDLELRSQVIEALREAFRHDSYGVAWEARLYGSDWGIALEDVDMEIDLWHGRMDANVPVYTAEKAASLLKHAKLRVVHEESHLSLPVNHLEEILECLLAKCT